MQNLKLERLTTNELLDIRDYVDALLKDRAVGERREIERTLARISAGDGAGSERGRPRSRMKGMKVAPKYRNPETGETWAGRGARPRWLQALMRRGRKLEEFAIAKTAGAKRSKRAVGRRKRARASRA
jgi:DNA-binding protein H-NS